MSATQIDSIIVEAESCAEGECALDEVESLISNLQNQQSMLSKRIEEIDGLVKDLEHINGRDDRPVDEVRETVRAIFRVFALGVSSYLLFLHISTSECVWGLFGLFVIVYQFSVHVYVLLWTHFAHLLLLLCIFLPLSIFLHL